MFKFQGNSRLKEVNLAYNGLCDEGAVAVADILKNNSILLELDITNNRITTQGAAAIAKGLEANETMQVFKVRHSNNTIVFLGTCSQNKYGVLVVAKSLYLIC